MPGEELPSEETLLKQVMLTSETIWKGDQLNRRDVELWLSNFKGEVFPVDYERKLALWLLSNYVFYNSDEVKHLCKLLYKDFLHEMLLKPEFKGISPDVAIKSIMDSTRFYCLGKPGESSAYILYYFRQENNLSLTHFISTPTRLEDKIKYVVFVDDVFLSGTQAELYWNQIKSDFPVGKEIILLSFFSTAEAVKLLSKYTINVISSISLDDRSRCFSDSSAVFANFASHKDKCHQFSAHYGEKVAPGNPHGFGNGQYIFGFFYNTPDNTLPIFWSKHSGWNPIVRRYDKKYKGDASNDLGKFI